MGSEVPFPFRTRPSTLILAGMPQASIACMPLLEEWGVPSRLASKSDFPGCYSGFVTELAAEWLASLGPARAGRGRDLRLRADADAQGHRGAGAPLRRALPGVAGGVHGLRGRRLRRLHGRWCAPREGPAMKRVCVDGPVFDAYSVF